MARDAAVQPSQDVSSRRPTLAELDEAAAQYGSIHDRWSGLDASQRQGAENGPKSGLVSTAEVVPVGIDTTSASLSGIGTVEPSSTPRESFPPPSAAPHRPPFDTLIGVPRHSFAPADPQKALRASTDAMAAPIEAEPAPRRSLKGLMAAAVILGALGVFAERLGLVDRAMEQAANLVASARDERTPTGETTTRSVGSLRTSNASPPHGSGGVAQPSELTDDAARALPSVASRQPAGALAPTSPSSGSSTDRGVPKDDTRALEDALPARAAPPASAAKDGAASKRVKSRASTNASGTSKPTAATREPSARSGTSGAKSPKEGAAGPQSTKDPRRTKPRSASQKPSRKSGQDGIIRQSPF